MAEIQDYPPAAGVSVGDHPRAGFAAEQLYGAGKGSVKLSYVEDELERRGLKADVSVIEATVREMNLLQNWELALKPEDEENGGDE